MQTQLIARELRQMGFSTAVENNAVIVGLKTRFLNVSEVRVALEQAFEGIEFQLSRIDSQKVRVQ